jgi:hypothetical protein
VIVTESNGYGKAILAGKFLNLAAHAISAIEFWNTETEVSIYLVEQLATRRVRCRGAPDHLPRKLLEAGRQTQRRLEWQGCFGTARRGGDMPLQAHGRQGDPFAENDPLALTIQEAGGLKLAQRYTMSSGCSSERKASM